MSEFKTALAELDEKITKGTAEQIEKAFEDFKASYDKVIQDSDDAVKAIVKGLEEKAEEQAKNLNTLSAKLNEVKLGEQKGKGYKDKFAAFIGENIEKLGEVRQGNSVAFDKTEMKVVADMLTTGDHVTGDYIRDYNRSPLILPGHGINVADLVSTVQIDGGTYTYIRETAGEGAVATQTEGSTKPQVDFDFAHIDVTTDFIAGITRYSRKMRNNLQYLQSFLPEGLRRQYFIAENTAFNTVLAAAATTSTNLIASFDNVSELILADVETLDTARYNPNGIAANKGVWYSVLKTEKSTGAGYGLPFGWTYENGNLFCLGIPMFKVDWAAATKFYTADWTMIEKVVTEGLTFEVSDQQYFDQNDIVAKIESQTALAVKQPASIIIGDTDAV